MLTNVKTDELRLELKIHDFLLYPHILEAV